MNKTFDYVETHITNHCNLNCAYCTHYAPLANEWYKDINEYVKEIAQLAYISQNSLNEFRILGGEPLLHPQVADFVYITRQAFPYVRLELVTNGILLPKMPDRFFETINNCRASVYLSDYNLSNEIKQVLEKKVNTFFIGNKAEFVKPALDLHGSDKQINFEECRSSFDAVCYNLRNGYLFHCPTEAYFDLFCNYFNIKPDFDVYDNGLNIFEADAEKLNTYINTPSNFCRFCQMKNKPTMPYKLSQKKASEWLA